MFDRKDEYQRLIIQKTGFQAFVILTAMFALLYGAACFGLVMAQEKQSILLPMLVSGSYFLFVITWKSAHIGPFNRKEDVGLFCFLALMVMGSGALTLSTGLTAIIAGERLSNPITFFGGIAIFCYGCLLGGKLLYNHFTKERGN